MTQKRSYQHRKAQRQVKKLEGNECQVCGTTEKPEGHHLIPYSEDGSASTHNMITMCQSCHRKYHQGELNIDIRRF